MGISTLHEITLALISCLYIEICRIIELAPIIIIDVNIDNERKRIIEKLKKHEESDKKEAKRFSEQLGEEIFRHIMSEHIDEFKYYTEHQRYE